MYTGRYHIPFPVVVLEWAASVRGGPRNQSQGWGRRGQLGLLWGGGAGTAWLHCWDVGALDKWLVPINLCQAGGTHPLTVASVLCDFVLLFIIYASPPETPTDLAGGNRADAVGPRRPLWKRSAEECSRYDVGERVEILIQPWQTKMKLKTSYKQAVVDSGARTVGREPGDMGVLSTGTRG